MGKGSDHMAAESQRMWNQTQNTWSLSNAWEQGKPQGFLHMKKFLYIPNIARDSVVCLGANITRADPASFYPGVTLALKR